LQLKFDSKNLLNRIDQYLYDPRLDSEALLRKRWAWLWMLTTLVFVLLMCFLFLIIFQLWPIWYYGAAFLLGYAVAFSVYPKAKRFDLVINLLFSYFMISIFFGILETGGLFTSLGMIFIGINCAMGSVLAGKIRWTVGMFALYCLTIILAGILQPYLSTPDYITDEVNIISFLVMFLGINFLTLFLVVLFMKDKSRFEKAESERIKKLDEAKTLLYTNISHEFRTPLTIIQGMAEQMEKHPEKSQQTGPGKIKKQSQSLLRLVNQMLDISKIEADSMQLNFIHGDIRKYVKYVTSSFQSLAENKDIVLHMDANSDPLYTDYDPEKLAQALSNLISNAIKFTPPGGHVEVEVSRGIEHEQQIVQVIVSDTGRGIPPQAIKHIFERFYQVPVKNDQTQGTGLGLALTRELIKLMNGDIHAESQVAQGTKFIVTLPINKEANVKDDHGTSMFQQDAFYSIIPTEENEKEAEPHPAASPEKPLLLIVEDNTDVIEYLVTILENDYMIELASNGMAGLDKAVKIIPDIILTDVMMPQMDGFEMLSKLKGNILTDHIPVVVLTARGDFPSKLAGLEIGADHYLVKPFSEEELILKLKNLLEARYKMQQKLGMLPSASVQINTQYKKEVDFLTRINELLDDHLPEEEFGIKDICLSLGLSRPQLYRKFTALTDKSIGRYIRSYRLYKAKAMIEKEGKNVTEAAMDTGFKNLSHFSTVFKEEFGYSPSELL